jgi:serine/threonine-protein kinase RsbT
MEISEESRILLSESTDNARAILVALEIANRTGFGEIERSLIATAVSELATNILRYAKEGSVTLKTIRLGDRIGIEVLAEDHGPGIKDLDEAMKDHVSTGNSLGLGLPSVKRIMDQFEIESQPGRGTRVWARKWR